jgi:hypothetical protein
VREGFDSDQLWNLICTRQGPNLQPYDPKSYTQFFELRMRLRKSSTDAHPYPCRFTIVRAPLVPIVSMTRYLRIDNGGRSQEIRDDTGIRTWRIRTNLTAHASKRARHQDHRQPSTRGRSKRMSPKKESICAGQGSGQVPSLGRFLSGPSKTCQ